MTASHVIDQGHGVFTIDTGYTRPRHVACHLMIEQGRAAFIDVGIAATVGQLLGALDERGVARANVDWVLVTHVHLDHAGAAGVLMRELPNARLVAHPRAARHIIDPSKLIAGAAAVYGEEHLRAEFGEILPVPAERVDQAPDGLSLALGGRPLLFIDTPGHARHHYCIYDERSRGIFAGDTFGLSYREFDTERGAFAFPTTSPVQFDPDALHRSIDRLLSFAPERIFVAHFGCVTDPARPGADLHRHIDALVALAEQVQDAGDERGRRLRDGMAEQILQALREHGCTLARERILSLMDLDIELNSQGIEFWLDHRSY
jgi:glyoxylase-like metal-dependent hydrolase (beta-lactamase superfamily II)